MERADSLALEQAGMVEQAIEHLRSAAESARQRFAYTEAAALLHRGIELRRQSAVSSAASHQELDLLLLLGTVLVTTEGYSAPEVGTTYRRALELARPAGGTRLFSSLSGLWVFHVVRGEVETSRRYALEFLDGAGDQAWPGLKLAGNFLLGSSLCHLGQFEPSRFHLSLALERPPTSCASVLEVFGGPDVRVFCRAYLAHVAWHRAPRGDDTSADTYINEAIQTADQMGHPFIQAIALTYATMLYALRDDSGSALQSGRRAVRVCTDNSFAYYLAMANVLTAWAVAAEGDVPAGLDQFREGFDSMRRLGAELRLPYFYALLAESYSRAGLSRDASASLSTGFAFAGKNGEAWGCSELHRVQGNLLAAEGNIREAGSSYKKALQIAQYCGSLAFERRIRRLLDVTQSLPGSLTLERS